MCTLVDKGSQELKKSIFCRRYKWMTHDTIVLGFKRDLVNILHVPCTGFFGKYQTSNLSLKIIPAFPNLTRQSLKMVATTKPQVLRLLPRYLEVGIYIYTHTHTHTHTHTYIYIYIYIYI